MSGTEQGNLAPHSASVERTEDENVEVMVNEDNNDNSTNDNSKDHSTPHSQDNSAAAAFPSEPAARTPSYVLVKQNTTDSFRGPSTANASFMAPSGTNNNPHNSNSNSNNPKHSTLNLLTKPFTHPVTEEAALENAVRQTLGHELVFNEDIENESALFVLQEGDEGPNQNNNNNNNSNVNPSFLEANNYNFSDLNNTNNNNKSMTDKYKNADLDKSFPAESVYSNNNSYSHFGTAGGGESGNLNPAPSGNLSLSQSLAPPGGPWQVSSGSFLSAEPPRTYMFRYNIRTNHRPPPFSSPGQHWNHSVENVVMEGHEPPKKAAPSSSASSSSSSADSPSHAEKKKKEKEVKKKEPAPAAPTRAAPTPDPQPPPPPSKETDTIRESSEKEETRKKVRFDSTEGDNHNDNHNNKDNKEEEENGKESGTSEAAKKSELDSYSEDPTKKSEEEEGTFLTMGCFYQTPIPASDVAIEENVINSFNALSTETRRMEMLEAFYVAHMSPFENNASFTGDNWNSLIQLEKDTKWFNIEFDDERFFFLITVFKRRVRIFLFSYLLRGLVIFILWVIMFNMLNGNYFSPGDLYFDTFSTILFAGLVGTLGSYLVQVPTIVGVIWAGILWNNVPYVGRLTGGISADMRQFIGMLGLSIGVVRAGLSLNVIRFKQKFKHFIAFSIVPASCETVVHAVCSKFIFGFDSWKIAFAEGFLVASIAPSVIVPIIISYQRKGYGVRDGPPMMILCSIAIDTALCLWGIQFLLALEFQRMNLPLLIVLAPVQVLVGIVGGILLGALVFLVTFFILFMEGERLPAVRNDRKLTIRHSVHVRYLSICFMVLIAFCEISIGVRFNCLGGAAVAVVFTAGTFNYLCVRGGTRDHLQVKADMAQSLTTVWDYFAMPALFGLSGANVNVHQLFDRSFIGQAFGLIFIGMGVRSIASMLTPTITGLGLSWRETLFCGVGWIGKGSVQGALGSTCYNYAVEARNKAVTVEQVQWAERRMADGIKMKNVAILGILVACPLCSIFLTRFTGKLLKPGT